MDRSLFFLHALPFALYMRDKLQLGTTPPGVLVSKAHTNAIALLPCLPASLHPSSPRPFLSYGTGIRILSNALKIKEKSLSDLRQTAMQTILFTPARATRRGQINQKSRQINRHTYLLEMSVSYRKQRTDKFLIATRTGVSVHHDFLRERGAFGHCGIPEGRGFNPAVTRAS
jgi:hypothetical protein